MNYLSINDIIDVMEAKEYLKQAKALDEIIRQQKLLLVELYEQMKGSSLSYDSNGSSASRNVKSPQERKIFKYLETEKDIENKIADCIKLKIEISNTINQTMDSDIIKVLSDRYLQYKEWYDIAKESNYSMSNIFRIHKQGLDAVQAILECSKLDK